MEDVPKHIEEIVRAAAAAPSGDNSQPWHFVFRAPATIEFHYHPEKDHPILNVARSGTFIALGAAIENATLEAKFQGFIAKYTLHPKSEDSLFAIMTLREGGTLSPDESKLHSAIYERHSNRKAYKQIPLPESARSSLVAQAASIPNLSLLLIEDQKKIQAIARNLTVMEEIALSNRILHSHFFASIFWSQKENKEGKSGLHGKTMELPPPAQALFRILKYWPISHLLAKVGFPGFVAQTNAKQNASASAFGAILGKSLTTETYIAAGRLLERMWLESTACGLSFQVVTGVLFLHRSMELEGTRDIFSPKEISTAKTAVNSIYKTFEVSGTHPILTFRVGYSSPATARSSRMKARIEVVH